MTKTEEYQNALNYITSEVFTGGNSILETEAEIIKKLLQPLIDQTKVLTLEEIKRMWEEAGYNVDILSFPIFISFESDGWVEEITIYENKEYVSSRGYFTFQEHQLLTKTFKALEKEKK